MKMNIPAVVGTIFLLASCGGSSVSKDTPFDFATNNAFSFAGLTEAEAEASADSLFDRIDALEVTEDLPTVGAATYDGVIVLLVGDFDTSEDGVLGIMRLTANFADGEFSGRGGDFVNDDYEETAGSVTISNGGFSSLGLLTADVSGEATFEAGRMTLDGEAIGSFFGPDAEGILSAIEGTATPDSGSANQLTGGFFAERQ